MNGIEIYFRQQLLCTGILNGDRVQWKGDPAKFNYIVGYYQRQGYEGEELLKVLLRKLRGNTWAQPLEEGYKGKVK
jgi:hypothetical protein